MRRGRETGPWPRPGLAAPLLGGLLTLSGCAMALPAAMGLEAPAAAPWAAIDGPAAAGSRDGLDPAPPPTLAGPPLDEHGRLKDGESGWATVGPLPLLTFAF